MTGLIVKDFLILRKTLRSYLVILLFYAALAFTGVWQPSYVSGFMLVMVSVLPMNIFAYDKQCKWDVYGLALPVGRTKTVASRYLVVLILSVVTGAVAIGLGVAMSLLGCMDESLGLYLLTCAILVVFTLIVNAVMLPLLYKFGSDRARIMLFGVMGLIALVVVVVLVPLGGLDWLNSLEEPTMEQIAVLPAVAAAAGLALLALSFLLSRHFYGNQDI